MDFSMQSTSCDEELVRDALYCRRMGDCGCFVQNLGVEALDGMGPRILPVIESVILADVEGNCTVFERTRFEDFPGLLDVMHSYFDSSDRFSLHSVAVNFLRRISFGARLDALDAIHRLVYWDKPLPREFRVALADIMSVASAPERVAIEEILERQSTAREWRCLAALHHVSPSARTRQ